METKLDKMNSFVFHCSSEKSELAAFFVLKQHSFFTKTNINEIDESEALYLDVINIIFIKFDYVRIFIL